MDHQFTMPYSSAMNQHHRKPASSSNIAHCYYLLVWFVHVVRDHDDVAGIVRDAGVVVASRVNQVEQAAVDLIVVVN